MSRIGRRVGALAIASMVVSCGAEVPPAAEKPAKLELIGHERELLKVTLTPVAEQRLGIATIATGTGSATRTITVHGEIVVPASIGGVPTHAQTDLAVLAASQVRAEGDIARARAELSLAQRNAARAAELARRGVGTVRASDEAQAEVAVAAANLHTAQRQRAMLGASPSALSRQGVLWVRAAAFAGDLGRIDRASPAQVRSLGTSGNATSVRPVAAPPSANASAGTVDLYYALPNQAGAFHVGQRVQVLLPATGNAGGIVVPASAILRDIYGGEWVYTRTAPHSYERRRVEIAAAKDRGVLVARGIAAGDQVVTAGAAELFGTEFGAK
jgi:multidrug efflux pump subunit AcrA (membrane-fusion protein)